MVPVKLNSKLQGNIYKVTYLHDLGLKTPIFVSYQMVPALSQKEATEIAKVRVERGSIQILNVEYIDNIVEYILDRWNEIDRIGYLQCWEPNISNSRLLSCLKRNNPVRYSHLVTDSNFLDKER